ncbi:hypothetical protein ACA910_005379 [Epithemia clementina (nom. ined.)]
MVVPHAIKFLLVGAVVLSLAHAQELQKQTPECKDGQQGEDCHPPTIKSVHEEDDNNKGNNNDDECGFYLAPSTIPGAGLGVYAASKIAPRQKILNDDVVIPLVDVKYHTTNHNSENNRENWLLSNYLHDSSSTMTALEGADISSLVPLTMVANTHPVLNNADMRPPENRDLLHRNDDVGAGAVSSYHGVQLVSACEIQAGEEIFVPFVAADDTANVWRLQWHQHTPSLADFDKARDILQDFSALVKGDVTSKQSELIWRLCLMSNTKWVDHKETAFSKGDTLQEIYDSLKKEGKDNTNPILERIYQLVKGNMSSKKAEAIWDLITSIPSTDTHVFRLLPKTMDNVQLALEDEEHQQGNAGLIRATVQANLRSLEWLKKNGVCIDNLQPKITENHTPQAGYGAFATRDISVGQVIAPVPVLPVNQTFLEMYKTVGGGGSSSMTMTMNHVWKKGHQLLLNYVYGHAESSLLLIPYGPGVSYINHGGSEQANAQLRWSKKLSDSTMLQKSPSALLQLERSGLVLELVALRDIAKDEEVTIDYGTSWVDAWMQYTGSWNHRVRSSEHVTYTSAAKLNHNRAYLLTPSERLLYPSYPDNVQLYCFTSYVTRSDGILRWTEPKILFNSTQHVHPCEVLERQFEERTEKGIFRNRLDYDRFTQMEQDGLEDTYVRYDVVIHTSEQGDLKVQGLPRKAIQFLDRSYTSDLHMSSTSFRHPMFVPDDLFPLPWLDRRSSL